MDPLPRKNRSRVLLHRIPIAMAISTILVDIGESSGRNRSHLRVSLHRTTCGLATYTYHRSWPSPCLTARR
ncbi:Uncharacterized protein TCM_022897 [Theobroma cacao]|uniref:Uncharacterized protein n=1 Tax=Theobroma cacao TaxID=3641 RepID=A0A061EUF0_THECC|nr:Uncharacterized protein TCM_022897 [Theobroma cacao]